MGNELSAATVQVLAPVASAALTLTAAEIRHIQWQRKSARLAELMSAGDISGLTIEQLAESIGADPDPAGSDMKRVFAMLWAWGRADVVLA